MCIMHGVKIYNRHAQARRALCYRGGNQIPPHTETHIEHQIAARPKSSAKAASANTRARQRQPEVQQADGDERKTKARAGGPTKPTRSLARLSALEQSEAERRWLGDGRRSGGILGPCESFTDTVVCRPVPSGTGTVVCRSVPSGTEIESEAIVRSPRPSTLP